MTPKEKANELGNKFYEGSVFDYDKQGHNDERKKAKERALICVDEIIDEIWDSSLECCLYWCEVEAEINKL